MKKIIEYISCPRDKLIVGKDISIQDVLRTDCIIWEHHGSERLIPRAELENAKTTIRQWYPHNNFKITPPEIYFMASSTTPGYSVGFRVRPPH